MKSPSIRQKKVIEKLAVNGGSMKSAMLEAGYSNEYASNPQKLIKTKSWEELLEEFLPDSLLTKVAQEGLASNKIVSAKIVGANANENTDDFIEVPDFPTRQKYLETSLKMKGKLSEKHDVSGEFTIKIEDYGNNNKVSDKTKTGV